MGTLLGQPRGLTIDDTLKLYLKPVTYLPSDYGNNTERLTKSKFVSSVSSVKSSVVMLNLVLNNQLLNGSS